MKSETKNCQNCKKDFTIESEDFNFYEKIKVPPPTFCPTCRLQRRLAFRNESSLHKRKCDFSSENMVSLYPAGTPFPVYHMKHWWSDKWDPLDYGQGIDWARPFLEQFQEVVSKTPRINLVALYSTLENSEYVNMAHGLKNCYLIFNSDYSENCTYGSEIENSKDCVDNLMIDSCSLCYECVNCNKCYMTLFSEDCNECTNVWFSKDCVGCSDCFGCVNLRSKKFHIFNKPYSKDAYFEKLKEFNLQSRSSIEKFREESLSFWEEEGKVKYMHGFKNENVSGDYINNSKNVHESFIVKGAKDCKYCMWLIVGNNQSCYDYSQYGENTELMYEVMQAGKSTYNVKFSYLVVTGSNVEYSDSMYGSSNCFGCVGLRQKQYCILNKQYSKEEYEKLILKIKKHMIDIPYVDKAGRVYKYGEFFPIEISTIPYNQSSAQDFYPITKEEAKSSGYSWQEMPENEYKISIKYDNIPDTLENMDDSILKEVFTCKESGKAFKIISNELEFYRRLNLPLPNCSPKVRQAKRMKRRSKPELFDRNCMKCGIVVKTSYHPDRSEIVYCEKCYQQEVY